MLPERTEKCRPGGSCKWETHLLVPYTVKYCPIALR